MLPALQERRDDLTGERNRFVTAVVLVMLLCLVVHARSITGDFINLDDPEYIVNNEAIRCLDLNLLKWSFGVPAIDLWIPLTWLSFALDYSLWKLNPTGYHLTNVLLHSVNSGLVVCISALLLRKEKYASLYGVPLAPLLAGLLWGIHPLRVESVAWITERKDVLNGLFTFASIYCYLRYVIEASAQTGARDNRRRWYILSYILFLISLLAKQISVMLPLALLLLDRFPLKRMDGSTIRALIQEKLPFFAVSAGVAALTLYFASLKPLMVSSAELDLWQRIIVSGNAIFEYCRLLVWPEGLIPMYIIPAPLSVTYKVHAMSAGFVTLLSLLLCKRYPAFTAAWLTFLIFLLPVLALIQNGLQALAPRYTYLSSVSLCILLSAGAVSLVGRNEKREMIVGSVTVAVLLCFAVATWQITAFWKDSETVWTREIALLPHDMAYFARGRVRDTSGKPDAALEDYTMSIRLGVLTGRPGLDNFYGYRADLLIRMKRYQEAVEDYTTAILMSQSPHYYAGRAIALKRLGESQRSEDDLAMAEKLADR